MKGLIYTECILISKKFLVSLPLEGVMRFRGRVGEVANMPAIDGVRSLPLGEGDRCLPH